MYRGMENGERAGVDQEARVDGQRLDRNGVPARDDVTAAG
jgi:hypothetical protein